MAGFCAEKGLAFLFSYFLATLYIFSAHRVVHYFIALYIYYGYVANLVEHKDVFLLHWMLDMYDIKKKNELAWKF